MMIVVLVFAVVSCGNQEPMPGEEADGKEKYLISFGTGGTAATWYILGGGIGSIIEKYNDNISVAVEATASAVENTKLIGSKEVEIAFSNPMELRFALDGIRDYEGNPFTNIRMIASGPLMNFHAIVPADSNVKSFEDIAGLRVSTGPAGSAQQVQCLSVLKAFGIEPDDIDEKNIGLGDAVTAMKDGNLDVILFVVTAPGSGIIDLTSSIDARFLNLEEDDINRIITQESAFVADVIPAGTYRGQDYDVNTVSIATLFVTHDETPDDLIYSITKTLYEHTDELAQVHNAGAAFTLDNPGLFIDIIPFHPGAEKYLKEVGVF